MKFTRSYTKYEIFRGIPEDVPLCNALLKASPFKAYSYHQLAPERIAAYHAHSVEAFFTPGEEDKQAILAKADRRIVGMLTWEYLEWDTTHFGAPCYLISHIMIEALPYDEQVSIASQLLQAMLRTTETEAGARFISVKIPGQDVVVMHALEQCGFNTIGTELVLKLPANAAPPGSPSSFRSSPDGADYYIRKFSHQIPDRLSHLYNIQTHDRFHRDPRLPQEACDKLWNESLHNACAGYADQQIIMAFQRQRPVAVVTIRCNPSISAFLGRSIASFFVVGVAPAQQKQGLGKWVLHHAIAWSLTQTPYIEVETQSDNYGALALYQKVGFQICCSRTIFHRWEGKYIHEPHFTPLFC